MNNCPAERYIPIYLVVGGVFGLLKSLANFFYRAKQRRRRQIDQDAPPEANVDPNPFDGIINCFLLAWFIAGKNYLTFFLLSSKRT